MTRTEAADMISHQGTAQATLAQTASPQAARRILIVDDEPKIRSFIGRALTAAGYLTDFAMDGTRGLRPRRRGWYSASCVPSRVPRGPAVVDTSTASRCHPRLGAR